MSAFTSPLSPVASGGVGGPLAGATPVGFEILQGSPGELEAAARECNAGAFSLSMSADDVRTGASTAVSGWHGQAEAAFVEYSGQISGALGANSEALSEAAGALQSFARELEQAQQVTRQAAGDCETYHGEMTAAAGQAAQAGQTADTLQSQAAAAVHPQMQGELNRPAGVARDQQVTASRAASAARIRV